MALTEKQRAELEALTPSVVRLKLAQSGGGRGAAVGGFKTGDDASGYPAGYLTRGDIEDWLAAKAAEEAALQVSTLRWAKIAGWAGIAGVVVGIVVIAVTVYLAK